MTAGLALGLDRHSAARFSFLLSIPVILLAGGLKVMELLRGTASADWGTLIIGTVLSGLSAYWCIEFFLKLIERVGMFPFVLDRMILGIILIVLTFG